MHLQARLGRGSRDLKSNWKWHHYQYPPNRIIFKNENKPFPHAAQHNDMNVIKYLVSCGFDIIRDGEFQISTIIAAEHGHYEMVVLLHEIGCDLKLYVPFLRQCRITQKVRHNIKSYYVKHGGYCVIL